MMRFLKKHYEKIILSVILLGLGATAVWFSGAVQEAQSQANADIGGERKTKWTPLDLTPERKALDTFNKPPTVTLTGQHNLFNPVTWKMQRDGSIKKILVQGAAALLVTNITPIYYSIAYNRKAFDSYMLTVTPGSGRPSSGFSRLNEKDKTKNYIITRTNDAPDGTSTLTLSIIDTGETVTLTTNNPYKRIDSFTADFQYPPDTAVFNRQRVNDTLPLSGEMYKIIAITNNAVRVQDIRTSQQTTIEWSGAH